MSAKYVSHHSYAHCEPLKDQPDSRQRILVVEDESDLRQATAEILAQAGYQVDVAENGAAAWSALRLYKYHLLITDQFMPKMSGVRLLKKIHDARLTLPAIMATGFLPTWELAMHPCRQPVKMLLKPYSYDKLLAMVKNLLPKTTSAGDGIAITTRTAIAATDFQQFTPPD